MEPTGKPPELDDPLELRAVALPAGVEALEAMAYVFAEEFARLGLDERQLLRLFRSPFYAGPHQAYRTLGERAIRAIVAECLRVWRRNVQDPPPSEGA